MSWKCSCEIGCLKVMAKATALKATVEAGLLALAHNLRKKSSEIEGQGTKKIWSIVNTSPESAHQFL